MTTTGRVAHIVGGATMVVAGLAGLTVTASAQAAGTDGGGAHDAMHDMMDDCADMQDMMRGMGGGMMDGGSGKAGDR